MSGGLRLRFFSGPDVDSLGRTDGEVVGDFVPNDTRGLSSALGLLTLYHLPTGVPLAIRSILDIVVGHLVLRRAEAAGVGTVPRCH